MFWRRQEPLPNTERDLWLVAGLGNPGRQYANTRHNAGFMVIDRLAERYHVALRGSKQKADVGRAVIEGQPALLAQPLTFMNESGLAVQALMRYYRVPVERLVVVCDDLDLPFGTVRVRADGSSGGNNGLKSIIQMIETQNFARVRIGVGRPRGGAIGHVLGGFPPEEQQLLPGLLDVCCDAVEAIMRDGVTSAMNQFNRDWLTELTS